MNSKTAKGLKHKALDFSRTEFARKRYITPEQAYKELKKLWLETPEDKKIKMFG